MKHFSLRKWLFVKATDIVIICLVGSIFTAGCTSMTSADKKWPQKSGTNKLVVHTDKGKYTINKNIYGHFSEHLGRCIYEGFWVGEDSEIPNTRGIRNDVVEALKRIKVPVLRWPGGCFADEYHWKEGIGPRISQIRKEETGNRNEERGGSAKFRTWERLRGIHLE